MSQNHSRGHQPRIVSSYRVRTNISGDLPEILQFLVPLRMAELRTESDEHLRTMAQQMNLASIIAGQGDTLQFRSSTAQQKRATAETLHALVTGLAILALTHPGGVTALGGHWCAEPPCPRCPSR